MRFSTPSVSDVRFVETTLPFLDHTEWCRLRVDTQHGMHADGIVFRPHFRNTEHMSASFSCHGFAFGAVLGIVQAGGFIPGPGERRKNSLKVSGRFCATDFWDAFDKGTGHGLGFATDLPDGNKALKSFCTPCVNEIWPTDLAVPPTRMHGQRYCSKAAPGFHGVLPGVLVKAVFVNKFCKKNFTIHNGSPKLDNFSLVRVCGQNWTRCWTERMCKAMCGRTQTRPSMAHRSNNGTWYCQDCADSRTNRTAYLRIADTPHAV